MWSNESLVLGYSYFSFFMSRVFGWPKAKIFSSALQKKRKRNMPYLLVQLSDIKLK